MNNRFKELAEQATEYANEQNKLHGVGYVITFKEKFAQLIVKECMDIARTVGNISEPDDFALDRCYEIEQRIQDRFGVEE